MLTDWLEKSITMEREGNHIDALDILFDNIDDMLLAGQFSKCSDVLANMTLKPLSNSQLTVILTATAAVKGELPKRKYFYKYAHTLMLMRGANADDILKGLE